MDGTLCVWYRVAGPAIHIKKEFEVGTILRPWCLFDRREKNNDSKEVRQ